MAGASGDILTSCAVSLSSPFSSPVAPRQRRYPRPTRFNPRQPLLPQPSAHQPQPQPQLKLQLQHPHSLRLHHPHPFRLRSSSFRLTACVPMGCCKQTLRISSRWRSVARIRGTRRPRFHRQLCPAMLRCSRVSRLMHTASFGMTITPIAPLLSRQYSQQPTPPACEP